MPARHSLRAGPAPGGANFGKKLNNSAAPALLGTYSARRENKARGKDAALPWAVPHPEDAEENGGEGIETPLNMCPVLSQAGWGQGDQTETKQPLDTRGLPREPLSPSQSLLGAAWRPVLALHRLGREWVQCRVCGCLFVPYKHQQGWGDLRRVGNRRNTAEEGLRLPGAAVRAPLGCFPPRQEVAHSASSRRRPRAPFAGDTRSPRRDAVTGVNSEARSCRETLSLVQV